jgi:hypothetical protein
MVQRSERKKSHFFGRPSSLIVWKLKGFGRGIAGW